MTRIVLVTVAVVLLGLMFRPLGGASSKGWPLRWPVMLDQGQQATVLVLGLDRRGTEPARTDAMLLIGVGPPGAATSALSIPRDLWVLIPERGEDRINTAYTWGDIKTGDGTSLARQTVEENLGVRVDRIAVVDFKCFEAAIDGVGGVDVDVAERLVDAEYPLEEGKARTVAFEPGRQRLSGERALQYVRTRAAGSDFSRMRHQQQVLAGLIERVNGPTGVVPIARSLTSQCPGLGTDLSPMDLLALGTVAASGRGLRMTMINEQMVSPATMPSGAQVLLPHWERIRPAVEEVFAQSGRRQTRNF